MGKQDGIHCQGPTRPPMAFSVPNINKKLRGVKKKEEKEEKEKEEKEKEKKSI